MASRRQQRETRRLDPQLYLVAELSLGGHVLAPLLAELLDNATVAAVLLRLPDLEAEELSGGFSAVVRTVQERGVALLLDGRPDLVGCTGADGAHLTGYEALKDAIGGLKPDRIAGAGGLHTRHDAMLVGEAGADYVMFGEADATGQRPSFLSVVERVAWWSEVFEVPCIGYALHLDEVAALAAAGADFVAVESCVWNDPRGAAAALRVTAEQLSSVEPV